MKIPRTTTVLWRALSSLLALMLATAVLLATPAPARAATSSVTGIDGVIYDACHNHSFRYSIDPDKAQNDWSLSVTAYDPRGIESTSEWVWKDEGAPSSGTVSGLMICGSEPTGTWRLEAELNFYSGGYNDEVLPDATFTMRRARSRASLAVNDTTAGYGQRLRFATRVAGEFPNGYFPLEYATARLQKYTSSGWSTIARATSNENGLARFSVVWRDRRAKSVRVVVAPGTPYANGVSRTIRIR